MKTVYALTEGEYSDYRVLAIFNDRATAERFAQVQSECAKPDVEEFTLFESYDRPEKLTWYKTETVLWDDGRVGKTRSWSYSRWNYETQDRLPRRPESEYVRAPVLQDKGGYLRVVAATELAAAKVTGERIAAFKAGSWIPQGNKACPRRED